jgi:uncharacterized protein (TIGR03066 family)
MRTRTTLAAATLLALAVALAALSAVPAQPDAKSPADKTVPVTAENFRRAESDLYFAAVVKKDGFGKFEHNREPTPIDKQTVIRMNRDTLYSGAVFDLDAGPVTITLPDAGKRFLSMQVIDEDQYVLAVVYGAGKYTYTREQIGTRYVLMAVRTLIDPANPKDLEEVHKLQDAIKVEQKGPGKFEVPRWDQASQKKVRDALLVLGSTLPDSRRMFGTKDQVDPVRHLIGTAMAWGGNPEKDAIYFNSTPSKNDGQTVYRLTVKDVPVDAFWSISVYNAEGYFQPNKENAYTLNNLTAKKEADGSVVIQFGGCDGKTPNCLPITPGWNYLVRLYRPRKEILDGTWKFPEAQPVARVEKKLADKLLGKWVVQGGEQDGATFDFRSDGSLIGRVNVKGMEAIIKARVRVEGNKLFSVTRGPTGKDDTRTLIIKTLSANELVLQTDHGQILTLKRAQE